MKKEQKPKLLVILGPTGSGKSTLAVKIARKFNGEIVSADSRQIYRGMDVGTWKITKEEIRDIKHHLIDIKNPNENYSVGEYKKDAIKAINEIIKKGKLPILVGGTGLYISAVINNWKIPKIKENKKLRKKLEKEIEEKGLDFVFQKLVKLDPEAANIIDSKNPRRVIRALEIVLLSGKKFSEQRKKSKPLYDILEIGINPSPEILKKRISERIKKMIKSGLINEVKKLTKKHGPNCKAFNSIGNQEIIDYLKNSDFSKFSKNFRKIENPRFDKSNRDKISLKEAISQINKNTWHYAKRQMTWFRKYNSKAHWVKNQSEAEKLVKKFAYGSWRN